MKPDIGHCQRIFSTKKIRPVVRHCQTYGQFTISRWRCAFAEFYWLFIWWDYLFFVIQLFTHASWALYRCFQSWPWLCMNLARHGRKNGRQGNTRTKHFSSSPSFWLSLSSSSPASTSRNSPGKPSWWASAIWLFRSRPSDSISHRVSPSIWPSICLCVSRSVVPSHFAFFYFEAFWR